MLTKTIDDTAPETSETQPLLCRLGFHDWVYLEPSREDLQQARRLISHGDGALGSFGGVDPKRIVDRLCPSCKRSEARFSVFLDSLRAARGVEK